MLIAFSRVVSAQVVTHNEEETVAIPNVIATIAGTLPPEHDQPVLLGNHR